MLQQEAACHTLVKAEASSNGAMDTATTAPVNVVAMTTATSMTVPEPMDEDPAVTISAQQVQGVQQTAVPQTVASQMFASRGVSVACSQPEILSVAPLQNPGLARPVMVQSRGNTQPLQPRPIPQPIVPQGSKVVPSVTVAGNQQVFFSTTSSPNKLIAIPGGNVPRFVQGLPGSIPRIQIVPQSRMSLQTTLRPIAPRLAANTNTAVRSQVAQIQLKPAAPRAGKQVLPSTSQPATGVGQQRVLLQAHSSSTQLRTIAPNLGNLPPGSKIQFPPGTIFKDGVVYVPQQVQSGASASGVSTTVQITPAPTSITQTVNGVPDPPSPTRQRKPCNCTKSQCLKLYCDCFANGEFCSNCNCNNCSNNIEHEQERSKAIKACLERNPHAFHPKIGKGKGETERRHNKGCHCKRSGCLKNYCECYEAKILCTNICKCTGCKNFEESPERKTLMHLADAAEVRVQQQNAAKTKLESQMEDLPSRAPILAHAGERLPFSFVTRDVVEATCRCLLVQASAAEKKSMSRTDIQKLILEEFGNCLLKVIHAANSRSAK